MPITKESTSPKKESLEKVEKLELETLQRLEKSLIRVNQRLDRAMSLRFRLLNGIVQGFGVVLGGTIIAYVVITILVETLRQINYIPIINMIFDSEYFSIFVERLGSLQTQLE